MNTITISQEHYSDLQMSIAKLLKQVDELKQQLANSLEIGSRLASNLQQERAAKPQYIAVATIDSWHLSGAHFPEFRCFASGYTAQEVYDSAINELREQRYRLTGVEDKAHVGSNFLYANHREVNIFITKC